MSSKQCDSFKVVISEDLAFIQNKLKVMIQISLTHLCLNGFSENDIWDAKNVMFECVKTTKKKTLRKRDGKAQKHFEDIIEMFRDVKTSDLPIFVVQNINKLPAIHFDHIDVSRLFKYILIIQKDILCIKQSYVTAEELHLLENDLENMKTASLVNNFERDSVNTLHKGGSKLLDCVDAFDSGLIGLLHIQK